MTTPAISLLRLIGNVPGWVDGWETYPAENGDNTNLNYLINGLLGPYVKNPAVYKCPANQSQASFGGVKIPRVRSVSMSWAFFPYGEGGWVVDTFPNTISRRQT